MTDPRRRLPGRRDVERLLDARGRHYRRPDGGDDRLSDELGRLFADAAAPPLLHDPFRELEAVRHFRAAVRRPAPAPRSVRQRVAALSATAKVVGLAVGATATGGVAIASTSMPLPLTHGLRPGSSESADYPSRPASHDDESTTAPGPASLPATAIGDPAASEAAAGPQQGRHDRRHGRGVVPGLPFPIGTFPFDDESDGGGFASTRPTTPSEAPTTTPATPPPPTTAPPTSPPTSRGPDYELPPPDDEPTDGISEPPPAEEIGTGEPTTSPTD